MTKEQRKQLKELLELHMDELMGINGANTVAHVQASNLVYAMNNCILKNMESDS